MAWIIVIKISILIKLKIKACIKRYMVRLKEWYLEVGLAKVHLNRSFLFKEVHQRIDLLVMIRETVKSFSCKLQVFLMNHLFTIKSNHPLRYLLTKAQLCILLEELELRDFKILINKRMVALTKQVHQLKRGYQIS
jgi:hypothetical protein